MSRIELLGGKYTVINELNEGGGFYALRYGEEWRNLAGDNLVLAMYHEIEELTEESRRLKDEIKTLEIENKTLERIATNQTVKVEQKSDFDYFVGI